MKKIWRNKYFQYSVSFTVALLFFLVPNWEEERYSVPKSVMFSGDTLTCSVMLEHSLRTKGHSMGYLFALMQKFSDYKQCTINISPNKSEPMSQWVELSTGKTQILILNGRTDSVPNIFQDIVVASMPLNDNDDVCVVKKENYSIIQDLNLWLTHFRLTDEYNQLQNDYFKKYRIKGVLARTISNRIISPYDDYVKKYANILGWDWKLITSLMYQESKFKLGLMSHRGAVGLMQIKQEVATKFGIDNIYDPESNIKAGIMHLARLEKMYRKMGADSTDLKRLTLAAYNCGEGRMEDCMELARQSNMNPLEWSNIVKVIPLLRDKEYYTKEYIKLGRFNGKETLRFVEDIMQRYNEYCNIIIE